MARPLYVAEVVEALAAEVWVQRGARRRALRQVGTRGRHLSRAHRGRITPEEAARAEEAVWLVAHRLGVAYEVATFCDQLEEVDDE